MSASIFPVSTVLLLWWFIKECASAFATEPDIIPPARPPPAWNSVGMYVLYDCLLYLFHSLLSLLQWWFMKGHLSMPAAESSQPPLPRPPPDWDASLVSGCLHGWNLGNTSFRGSKDICFRGSPLYTFSYPFVKLVLYMLLRFCATIVHRFSLLHYCSRGSVGVKTVEAKELLCESIKESEFIQYLTNSLTWYVKNESSVIEFFFGGLARAF